MNSTPDSNLPGLLHEWSVRLEQKPSNHSHWLEFWSRLTECLGAAGASAPPIEAIASESLTERLLMHFLELKGVKIAQLDRANYVFKKLLQNRFPPELTVVFVEEISALLRSNNIVLPERLFVNDDAFLAVGGSYAIVTSGGMRQFFPCVDESIVSPTHSTGMIGGLSAKIEEAFARMKDAGTAINKFCFIEKAFGPVGLISVASQMVRAYGIPAINYRSYAWNATGVRVASGIPNRGDNLCAIYDVAVSGSMLVHAAEYFRYHYGANMCAAVVYYDMEEGARDRLAKASVELFAVNTKHNFWPALASEYQSYFNQPLKDQLENSVVDPDPTLVNTVEDALTASVPKEEHAIIDAFESYVERHADELSDGRLAVGSRVLTWQDVVQEMRDRTPFGELYLQSLAEGTIETLLGIENSGESHTGEAVI